MKHQKILYTGLDPQRYQHDGEIVHLPLIQTMPRPFTGKLRAAFENLSVYTHVVITSRTAAKLYMDYASLAQQSPRDKIYISVGVATTRVLEELEISVHDTATEQTGEGIVRILHGLDLQAAHLFFPRSALAREVIPAYCVENQIRLTVLDLYDTLPRDVALPDLTEFEQIVFTSPSTVHAFFKCVKTRPSLDKCCPIGPVTEKALKQYY